jgi:phosphate transport system substrate-binding protein
LKNRRNSITGLLGLMLVLNGAPLIGAYAKQTQPAADPSHQPIVRLMDSHPGDRKVGGSAEPIADGGNDEAIRSLLDKKCEVAVTSRKMRTEEIKEAENRGLEIKETIAGWVGIAVAVHPTNPINELTADQVRKVIAGEYASWNEVGGTEHPISIAKAGKYQTATKEDFTQIFLKARLTQMAPQTKHLSEEPNAVALIRFEETAIETQIKILAIKKNKQSQSILPSRETVDCGTYPFRHPLYAYVDWKNATDAAKAFFNFLASQSARTSCK